MARAVEAIPESVLRVALARGVGPRTFDALREAFGDLSAIADASADAIARLDGFGRKRAQAVRREIDLADVDAERDAMAEAGVTLIAWGDEDYPPLLAATPDAPKALWVKGAFEPADHVGLAIVGSRRCTTYGREQAGRFAGILASCGLTIVSGGARGIDTAAHRGALRAGGRTVVVTGCGLSRVYPPEHADLFDEIAAGRGAILSEFPMATPPRAEHFPRRNRIISGLSLGVLVVEAGRRSGASITARLASEEHGREVMALPTRVDSDRGIGGLEMLRDGWAAIVVEPADVLKQLESSRHLLRGAFEWDAAGLPDPSAADVEHAAHADGAPTFFEAGLTDAQAAIVKALKSAGETLPLDALAARAQLDMHVLMSELTMLEIRGAVLRRDGRVGLRP